MKKIGIWIDKENAHIVALEEHTEILTTIKSNIDHFHVVGGARSKTKWGPQHVVHDSKYLEREKHQLKLYFKRVIDKISEADSIIIFGPADTNAKLQKELNSNFKNISSKVQAVKKTDSMTTNQIIAYTRSFFAN